MRSVKTFGPAAAALFLSVALASCTVTSGTESGGKPDDAKFLEALSGPIRDSHPDSALLQEGQKACDAFAKGQTQDQVKQMVEADLGGVDFGQFIGALDAGKLCSDQGGN